MTVISPLELSTGQREAQPQSADEALAKRILVAVPVLNEGTIIETSLRSLITGSDVLRHVEFVVADGGSTDTTLLTLVRLEGEFDNLRVIHNPGKFQSAGVNAVARLGAQERDILIRCDAHSVYPENFVLSVARSMEETDADGLAVPMDAVGKSGFQKANAWIVDTLLGSGGAAHRGGHVSGFIDHGHHAGFRREKFLELGGYDEGFTHNEDAEYDARLTETGGSVYLDADIRLKYYPRDTLGGVWRQYYNYGRGRARNVIKNNLTMRLRQMLPILNILMLIGSITVMPFNALGFTWPVMYLGLLAFASLWMAVRHRALCGLYAGLALGAMHLAWGSGFIVQVFRSYRERQTVQERQANEDYLFRP